MQAFLPELISEPYSWGAQSRVERSSKYSKLRNGFRSWRGGPGQIEG